MPMTRSSDLLSQSLALAIARYLTDQDGAADRAGAWLDDDVRSRLDATTEQLAEEAANGLDELEEWRDEADSEEWEAGRVEFLQAQLNFQSARTGFFSTASGSLVDFLNDMGESPDVLDEH
jgi:hypothetical protein